MSENVIRRGMNRLQGHWTKGAYKSGNNVCGFGSLMYDANGIMWDDYNSRDYHAAGNIMSNVAREQFPERTGVMGFPVFNDHEDTVEEEVVMVMEKAAIKWDELYG